MIEKRLLSLVLLLALISSVSRAVIMYVEPAAGGGVAWTDSFTRANNTDVTANCSSEGPNDLCDWVEVLGDLSIAGNELHSTAANFYLASGTDTSTLAQYSGATHVVSPNSTNAGPSIRGTGGGGGGDCHYVFRNNSTTGYALRACNASTSCSDIESFTDGAGDFTDMILGDALGVSSDTGTGDSVVLTVWKFDAVIAPTSFAGWPAAASNTYTVCASGCDKTWTTAPSFAKCTADNKRVGLYSGSANANEWDNWSGGG